MYSVVIDLEEMKQHDAMFWLPARGRDNGVPAENWVMLCRARSRLRRRTDSGDVDRRRRRRVRRAALRPEGTRQWLSSAVRGHDAVPP